MSIRCYKKIEGLAGEGVGPLKSLIYIAHLRTMLNQQMSNTFYHVKEFFSRLPFHHKRNSQSRLIIFTVSEALNFSCNGHQIYMNFAHNNNEQKEVCCNAA